jgi:uncharacterized RDD family membrane protein YckC
LSDGSGDGRLGPSQRGAPRRRRRIEYGLLGRRVVAAAIDFLCVAIAAALVAGVFMGVGGESANLVFMLSLVIAWFVYDTGFVGSSGQATPGQRATGIEIVSIDNAPIGRFQAALWSFVFLAGIAVSGGLTLLFPLIDPSGRAVNDLLAAVRVRWRKRTSAGGALAERHP